MSITVVTSLFDLARREGSPARQSAEFYIEHALPLLHRVTGPLVIYADPELVPRLQLLLELRAGRFRVIPMAIEQSRSFLKLPAIARARLNYPFYRCNPAKDTPLYHVFQRTKYELLGRTARENPLQTSHVAWIDFGIAKAVPVDHVPAALEVATKLERPEIVVYDRLLPVGDFRELRQRVAAGYIAGPVEPVADFCDGLIAHADRILERDIAPHDETLIEDYIARLSPAVSLRLCTNHRRIFSDQAPLLGLVMIVKNEAHGIVKTLASILPHVDRATIVDTGSTDGTQDVVRAELARMPKGCTNLVHEPFVDFATTRNYALDAHDRLTPTAFTLMVDSDDILRGGKILRAFLEGQRAAPHESYGLRIDRGGDLFYELPLVRRTTTKHRYTGRVHEYTAAHTASLPPNVVLTQHVPEKSLEQTKRRWVRDLAILAEDVTRRPDDARAWFYLAQTQECLGLVSGAVESYERRIALGDFPEEIYESKFRRARLMRDSGRPWRDAEEAFLDAHSFDPRHAEPLFEIADHYYASDNHAMTFLFARRAAELPIPDVKLYVTRDIYTWRAAFLASISGYYLGGAARAAGKRLADQAVRYAGHDELIRSNRACYAESARETFGAQIKQIAFTPPEPFVATNPSVHYDPAAKRWRCLVRTTNYRIVDGQYLTPDDNVIFTRNVMLELTDELDVSRMVPMIDRDPTPRSSYPVHGFEDCRLFQVGDRLLATATVCDFTPHGQREIVLLELGEHYEIARAVALRGAWSAEHQKNWMPAASSPDFPSPIVYAVTPPIVLRLRDPGLDGAPVEGGMLPLHRTDGGADDQPRPPLWRTGRLRGGSQAVAIGDGRHLCLVHDVTFSGRARTYLHRFVELDEHLRPTRIGDLFYFHKRGIEFCAGLAYDPERGRLVASFGIDDSSAMLATFPLGRVLAGLRNEFVI